jgi:hypothetical protein
MHDATEAYIGDMVRPLKQTLPEYSALEYKIERVIAEAFGLPVLCSDAWATVKHADNIMLMTERRDLVNHGGIAWTPRATARDERVVPLAPRAARELFLDTFLSLPLNQETLQKARKGMQKLVRGATYVAPRSFLFGTGNHIRLPEGYTVIQEDGKFVTVETSGLKLFVQETASQWVLWRMDQVTKRLADDALPVRIDKEGQ